MRSMTRTLLPAFSGWTSPPAAQTFPIITKPQRRSIWSLMEKEKWSQEAAWMESKAGFPPKREMLTTFVQLHCGVLQPEQAGSESLHSRGAIADSFEQ